MEKWIRAQFGVYLRALLLAADGRGGQMADFNLNFVACFRTTYAFIAWRSQIILPSVMQQLLAPPQSTDDETYAIGCADTHPGRNFPSNEPTDQIVNNLKQ